MDDIEDVIVNLLAIVKAEDSRSYNFSEMNNGLLEQLETLPVFRRLLWMARLGPLYQTETLAPGVSSSKT